MNLKKIQLAIISIQNCWRLHRWRLLYQNVLLSFTNWAICLGHFRTCKGLFFSTTKNSLILLLSSGNIKSTMAEIKQFGPGNSHLGNEILNSIVLINYRWYLFLQFLSAEPQLTTQSLSVLKLPISGFSCKSYPETAYIKSICIFSRARLLEFVRLVRGHVLTLGLCLI